jgi:hypothetical protein
MFVPSTNAVHALNLQQASGVGANISNIGLFRNEDGETISLELCLVDKIDIEPSATITDIEDEAERIVGTIVSKPRLKGSITFQVKSMDASIMRVPEGASIAYSDLTALIPAQDLGPWNALSRKPTSNPVGLMGPAAGRWRLSGMKRGREKGTKLVAGSCSLEFLPFASQGTTSQPLIMPNMMQPPALPAQQTS